MIPTPIGAVFAVIGLYLLTKPTPAMLAFALIANLFAGASAIDMPLLGHSSIPPSMLALGFVLLRVLLGGRNASESLVYGFSTNAWLLVFCTYCALSALILPRIFAGRINVIPLGRASLGQVPLFPSSQNTTQAFYLLGTGAAAIVASAVGLYSKSVSWTINTLVVATWVHVLTGVMDLSASYLHLGDVFAIVRNASYQQLSQDISGLHRISGMTPEPSSYAALGGIFFVFMTELWIREIASARTGPAAAAMLALLVLSTSSTAYLIVLAYGAVLFVRMICIPGSMRFRAATYLVGLGVSLVALCIVLVLLRPSLAESLSSVLADMTLRKSQSSSGLERAAWAAQGWTIMAETRGLGAGVGSFRSSNLYTAILGSVGPAGLTIFLIYCLQIGKLGRRSTYLGRGSERVAAGAAAGWTVLVSLVPAATGASSADPGILFAILAGLSLAWRSKKEILGGPVARLNEQAPLRDDPRRPQIEAGVG